MCPSGSDTLTLSESSLEIEQGLKLLCTEMGMLSGLSVSFGTADQSCTMAMGLAQEALLENGCFMEAIKPVSDNSLYDLASLTKVFTAVCVLQLIERGKIRLEDGFGRLDPRFANLRDVSVYDVLTYQAVLRTRERVDIQADAQEAEALIFDCRRFDGPEPERLYSDMNALLCKYLVESVSGFSFEQYLEQYIFSPLGMKDTFARVPEQRIADCLNYNYEHRVADGQYFINTRAVPGLPHDPKARLLISGGRGLCGHAGIFSTAQNMVQFAQGLLAGSLLSRRMLLEIGRNRTGRAGGGRYRQYLGYLCFSKSSIQRFSEVPAWMGESAFGQAGYTGNHLAIDPQMGVFDLLLGNRCHMRVSAVEPGEQAEGLGLSLEGAGSVTWPDGRRVMSSFRYVHQKDRLIHDPVLRRIRELGWLNT